MGKKFLENLLEIFHPFVTLIIIQYSVVYIFHKYSKHI